MDQLLALCPGADAVFCATDSIALGALARLQEAGRQIPEEVALAGVGDTVSGRIVSPKLTSVHFYYKTSGKEAARLLLELLDGNEARNRLKWATAWRKEEPRGSGNIKQKNRNRNKSKLTEIQSCGEKIRNDLFRSFFSVISTEAGILFWWNL